MLDQENEDGRRNTREAGGRTEVHRPERREVRQHTAVDKTSDSRADRQKQKLGLTAVYLRGPSALT